MTPQCTCYDPGAGIRPSASTAKSIGQLWTCPRCGKRWVTHILATPLPEKIPCWMEA